MARSETLLAVAEDGVVLRIGGQNFCYKACPHFRDGVVQSDGAFVCEEFRVVLFM